MMMIENTFNSSSNEIWMKIVKTNKMPCSAKSKKKIKLNRLKNGLNKKIYEKLNDERGRKKNINVNITATRNCSSQKAEILLTELRTF